MFNLLFYFTIYLHYSTIIPGILLFIFIFEII